MKRVRKISFEKTKVIINEKQYYSTISDSFILQLIFKYCKENKEIELKNFIEDYYSDKTVVKVKCNKKEFLSFVNFLSEKCGNKIDTIEF